MKNKNNNTNNGINSGFLLGFILGVLATLLLTTKKGREILKEFIDKGIQKITDLEELHEKTKQKQEPEPENDYIKPKPEEVKKEIQYLAQERKVNEKGGKQEVIVPLATTSKVSTQSTTRRLFFRKAQKKSL